MLHGQQVVIRPLARDDVAAVARIQAEPGVACWWGLPDETKLHRMTRGATSVQAFVIEHQGEVAGLIQFFEEDDPDFRHAGIDLFLAERHQRRGLGPDALRTVARYLIEQRGHHRLTIDPAASNQAAIRAFAKVGFHPVGVLREYWRAPDGTWRDGLLMELLARDLTAG
jgi:aminoglycoside 6'-N-acetyltransferase